MTLSRVALFRRDRLRHAAQATASTIVQVVAPAADDRLALAAGKAGMPVHVLANPKIVPGDAIAEGTDLIVAAHTHARVSNEALARSRLGGIGYHPSLLPRHRGHRRGGMDDPRRAIRSPAARSITWPTAGMRAPSPRRTGASSAKGETARELWERALAPMGLASCSTQVVRHAREHGSMPALQAGRALRHAGADDQANRIADRGEASP